MAPTEFHRYTDNRGDTIIYKFDPEVARNPDPAWPNDSAVSVYHHYTLTKPCTINYHSDLLPLDLAVERWRTDKQSSQPIIGMVMYKESDPLGRGFGTSLQTQYIWKGWNHGEGYRRGWAKLQIGGHDRFGSVTAAARNNAILQRGLNRFPQTVATVPKKEKERKDSKISEDSEVLQDMHESQVAKGKEKISQDQHIQGPSSIDIAAPKEPHHEQRTPVDKSEKEQELKTPKHEKRKHGKRGKKMHVDYRLAFEEWPDLLHTPR